eukprot:02012.XXX_16425_14731_1 [CDS] Oithona nana genome sequencing.
MEPAQKISLNVHLQVPSSTASAQDGSHTPNTPEIVNSIVNMTAGGPFLSQFDSSSRMTQVQQQLPQQQQQQQQPIMNTEEKVSGSSISNLSSPSTPGSSMSVQAYTSQFIKEGLRIKMKQKMGSSSAGLSYMTNELPSPSEEDVKPPKVKRIRLEDLAPEDMVRRQRRRERNKVAATKCRNKKKARTHNLMKESEILDAQNKALKIEITKLESEKTHLMDVLQQHEPACARKLKEAMKSRREQMGDFDDLYETDQNQPEFRVPLPPASTVTSRVLPMVKVSPPEEENEPPTFAEAIRMVSEVKQEEEEIVVPAYNMDYFGSTDFYPQQAPFLAKRPLGQTYLDLDSRCIAL